MLPGLPDAFVPELGAADSGRIVIAGWTGGYGNYTCIQHTAKLSTCYGHQSAIQVRVGQSVNKGQVIGFYSALIVYRSLSLPDVLALMEPRSRAARERLCGGPMTDTKVLARAEAWRPYRMWMTFLARAVGDSVPA